MVNRSPPHNLIMRQVVVDSPVRTAPPVQGCSAIVHSALHFEIVEPLDLNIAGVIIDCKRRKYIQAY